MKKFLNLRRLQLRADPSGPVSNQYIIIAPENPLSIETNKNENSDILFLLKSDPSSSSKERVLERKKALHLAKLFGIETKIIRNETYNTTTNK